MKISPTRVTFNYPQNQTPSRIFSPNIIKDGYIVGEPIIVTNVSQFSQIPQTLSPISSRQRTASYIAKQGGSILNY
jgi:hypothetical protein